MNAIEAPEAQSSSASSDSEWPMEEIKLYGPGTDSGTFDYFTDAIVGEEGASRADYTASEDDNVLVTGVQVDRYALAYFGYAYYHENRDKLRLIPVDGGSGPVTPTPVTINDGTYAPLSRPIFIYVNNDALQTPAVAAFLGFYLDQAAVLASEVGYVALPESVYAAAKARVAASATGSAYLDDAPIAKLVTPD